MDFEAMPLYNKFILRSATSKEARNVMNKHVSQKQKKCAWKIKSGVTKCTVCDGIKGAVKKEYKRVRNDGTRLLQEVRAFHKRYFSLRDCIESEQMACL